MSSYAEEPGAAMNALHPVKVEAVTGVGERTGNSLAQIRIIEETLSGIEMQLNGGQPITPCDDVEQCLPELGLVGATTQLESRLSGILERSREIRDRLAF